MALILTQKCATIRWMHVPFLVLAVFLISWSGLPFGVQVTLQAILLALCIPDMILAFRKSPPFVPSFGRDRKAILKLAAIQKNEIVIDPGCGDGRLVFDAAAQGAKSIGYEFAIPAYAYAKLRSFFHPGSTIRFGDFWQQDYTHADIILCYLLPETMQKFHTLIWPQLKPGCRVVSHAFRMKDIKPKKSEQGIHLYIK